MTKSTKFWLILAAVLIGAGLFFLPFSPIRFGGYFLVALGACCAGEGWMTWLAPKKRAARMLSRVGLVLFALFCLSFVGIQGLIVSGEHADPEADDAQYVLVLGAHILQDRPSDALIERLKTADAFLEAHPDATAILCGGQGVNEPMPESHMMQQYMVEVLGTDPDRLLSKGWNLGDCNNKFVFLIVDTDGTLLYFSKGEPTKEQIKEFYRVVYSL